VAPISSLNGLTWRQRPVWARAGIGSPGLADLPASVPETTAFGRVVTHSDGCSFLVDPSGEIALGGAVPDGGGPEPPRRFSPSRESVFLI